MLSTEVRRRLPVGAEVLPEGGAHFRVWAPRRRRVAVVLEGHFDPAGDGRTEVELRPEEGGYFAGPVPAARAGTLYRFRLDGDERLLPDPVSRFQPDGPHGPSQVIDPAAFRWADADWRGVARDGQVIYELHLGTFTPEGTWEAAARELPELAGLGVTMIEVMPVADFPGRFGWGYDGVDLFAPCRLYGTPDDMRRFVDRAHALGVAVILDVVFNHFGPDGCYLREFSEHYFTDRHTTDWGEPINYDGPSSGPVREFFVANAGYWIDEFHLDGLRLDATQNVYDDSPDHILAAVGRRVRQAAGGRGTYVVAENEPQHVKLVRPADRGGYGLDALWNDDFHHTARVALTGRNEAYYTDYLGTPQEFISALKWGYLFQGQRYRWQKKRRGTPALDQPPAAFVNFIENHDQVSNSARGLRAHQLTSPGRYRAMTALLLLAPGTPLLFQGQEFAASSPFLFFADHAKDLAESVRRGRAEFLGQFPSIADPQMRARLADPHDPKTFQRCKLDLSERQKHAGAYALHRDLLRLRRDDPVFRRPRPRGIDGAVLGPGAFLLRYFAENGDDRLVVVNFGRALHLDPAPEPLLAPPEGKAWRVYWSSEDPRYGGCGTAPPETEENWRIPGEAALVLVPAPLASLRSHRMSATAPPDELVRTMPWAGTHVAGPEPLLEREWLVTNGLGGYAAGTVSGAATRRYHGLLVAALPAPPGRWMMLNHLSELIRLPDGTTMQLGGEERVGGALDLYGADHLAEFRLEAGLPVWLYRLDGYAFEKRVFLPHEQNTAYVNYRLVAGGGVLRLKLRPAVHFREHDAPVSEIPGRSYRLTAEEDRYELSGDPQAPTLRLRLCGPRPAFTIDGKKFPDFLYRVEESRGYDARGDLWSPGYFRADLTREREVTLVASTEPWEVIHALEPADALAAEHGRRRRLIQRADPAARAGFGAELVLAADQFLITPAGRAEEAARARAAGDEVRTVIAGYHWFTDWGRDTMIGLPGLALATGRHAEAGYILRTFAHYVRDGLIPNLFPEGRKEGLYHTADATLWFFQATAAYLEATGDGETLRRLLPKFLDIVEHHLKGTRFGIHVDPADGLLVQGAEGYQLTWMDAKVGDWVVTPRRGKAVEINALWYNALRHLEGWLNAEGDAGRANQVAGHAERARDSFNRRFWYAKGGYLYDVVDAEGGGDDPSCRPNQVFAISLAHPVLDRARWQPVLDVVRERLLTPVGLRSLAPGSPDYKAKYYGDLRSRDAAYHQGTVWAWLIGPFIDAWLKVHPGDRAGARCFLEGFASHLDEACVGSVSEIFDAEEPFTPRGCVAQAWSVAEVLRCWVKMAHDG